MKRKWLMVPLVTGMLAVGLTGATALAHNEDGEEESPKTTVATKVAEILGMDEQIIKDALQEATQEVHSERTQHRLGHMVEAGRITQEESDAYLGWYAARPDVPNLHFDGHRMFGEERGGNGESEETRLDRMVAEGQITQDEADAYAEWLADRPEMSSLHQDGQRMSGGRGEGEDKGDEAHQRPGFGRGGEGEDGEQSRGRGPGEQRFGGRGFPGLSQLPNGQDFPGQGELPYGLGDDVPTTEGTSY
ncbi:MAG: hypothetical protein HQ475_11820 [SAR202 cluster bacterium]|nr:hypothetical protein [SAR202 cluster bacterium]